MAHLWPRNKVLLIAGDCQLVRDWSAYWSAWIGIPQWLSEELVVLFCLRGSSRQSSEWHTDNDLPDGRRGLSRSSREGRACRCPSLNHSPSHSCMYTQTHTSCIGSDTCIVTDRSAHNAESHTPPYKLWRDAFNYCSATDAKLSNIS